MRYLLAMFLLVVPALAQDRTPGLGPFQSLYANFAPSSTTAVSTEEVLTNCSYPLAAGKLANVGDTVIVFATGSDIPSTDTKNIRLRIIPSGAPGIVAFQTSNGGSSGTWTLYSEIMKTGPSTQIVSSVGSIQLSNNAASGTLPGVAIDTAIIPIQITGQNVNNATAASITCKSMTVRFIGAPLQ